MVGVWGVSEIVRRGVGVSVSVSVVGVWGVSEIVRRGVGV